MPEITVQDVGEARKILTRAIGTIAGPPGLRTLAHMVYHDAVSQGFVSIRAETVWFSIEVLKSLRDDPLRLNHSLKALVAVAKRVSSLRDDFLRVFGPLTESHLLDEAGYERLDQFFWLCAQAASKAATRPVVFENGQEDLSQRPSSSDAVWSALATSFQDCNGLIFWWERTFNDPCDTDESAFRHILHLANVGNPLYTPPAQRNRRDEMEDINLADKMTRELAEVCLMLGGPATSPVIVKRHSAGPPPLESGSQPLWSEVLQKKDIAARLKTSPDLLESFLKSFGIEIEERGSRQRHRIRLDQMDDSTRRIWNETSKLTAPEIHSRKSRNSR